MDKTHFSKICHVLTQLWLFYRDEADKLEEWKEFFNWADIALPLAFSVDNNYVSGLKAEGRAVVNETWSVFCEMIDIDEDQEYTDVFAAFAASSNPTHGRVASE